MTMNSTMTTECVLALAIATMAALTAPAAAVPFPNGVAAGDVTSDSVVLWARAEAPTTITFDLSSEPGFGPLLHSTSQVVADAARPAKTQLVGLTAGTTYYYRATDSSGAASTGTFRTPAAIGDGRQGLRFGVSGDWRQELTPYPAITNAPARNLDFFVKLGDTIYADYPSPNVPAAQATTLAEFRAKHEEALAARSGLNSFADLRRSTAIYATIDDHEVTNDFQGGAAPASDSRFLPSSAPFINRTPLYDAGLQAFREYMPIADSTYVAPTDPRSDGVTKLYRSQSFGSDAAIFVLDARSFRDPGLPGVGNPADPAQVGGFLAASADPSRTMIGATQFADLKADLLSAQGKGVLWKFVMLPEPIQNLGVVAASDRYEGYAAERTALLQFIKENAITNVVFVSADIHGTLVNNLNYRISPFGPEIATSAFEITTGSVAFDAPFGPTIVQLAQALGLITPAQAAAYSALPAAFQEAFITGLLDAQIASLGYDPIGLDGSLIDATLIQGGYTATNSYGWTEFEIDADTGRLLITTWGIDAYDAADLASDPAAIAARVPRIVSRFAVDPTVPAPGTLLSLLAALACLAMARRKA